MKRVLRVAILVSPLIILMWAGMYHLNVSGERMGIYTLDRQTTFISPLFPARRLFGIQNGRQQVREDPVYFTVRALRPYDTARVTVRVDNPAQRLWKLGLAIGRAEEWIYDLHELTTDGAASFNLAGVPREGNAYRFVISAPGLTEHDGFFVDEISVTLAGTGGMGFIRELFSKIFSL